MDSAAKAVDWARGEPPARVICVPDNDPVEEEAEMAKFVTPPDAPALNALTLAVQNEKKLRLESKRKRREEAVKRMTPGAREVYRFREFLIKKFGNLVRGWVLVFDRDKSGSVTRKEFFAALNEIKYKGDASTLWRRIDKDHSGTMTLSELAPKSSDEIADFKHWARRKYGGMKEALVAMDTDRSGKLNLAEFVKACVDNGFA